MRTNVVNGYYSFDSAYALARPIATTVLTLSPSESGEFFSCSENWNYFTSRDQVDPEFRGMIFCRKWGKKRILDAAEGTIGAEMVPEIIDDGRF